MSLLPTVTPTTPGERTAIRLGDLERRVDNITRRGTTLGVGSISGGASSSSPIATGTIVAGDIQAGTITAAQIAAGTIVAGNIAAGTITAAQIAANTITAGQIAAGTITATQIAAHTISASVIAAGTITAAEIAAATITGDRLVANTITAGQIAAGTITATEIAAATITGGLIAASTITATNIAAATITGSLIASATITGDRLVADTITSREIVGTTLSAIFADLGTVTAGTLRIGVAGGQKVAVGDSISTSVGTKSGIVATDSSNVITFWADPATGNLQLKGQLLTGSTGLGSLAAGGGTINGNTNIAAATITNDRLVANTITAASIAAGTITTVEIAANTIVAGDIAAGTITATQIAAGTITADRMNVTSLSAITADLGTITAGSITGATIRTASSGARVEISGTAPVGIKKYDASGNVAVTLGATDGLDLLTGTTNSPPDDRRIRWTRSTGEVITELISGSDAGTVTDQLTTISRAKSASRYVVTSLQNRDSTDATIASFELRNRPDGLHSAKVTLDAATTTIIDATGVSDFLQLAAAAKKLLASGSNAITAGTSNVVVTHGLGTTPTSVVVTPRSGLNNSDMAVTARSSTTFTITYTGGNVGGTITVDWVAIG